MPIARRSAMALAVIAFLLAAAFIAVPAWQLVGPGPFDWHVAQPAYWQGGLEGLALMALVATAFALSSARMAVLLAGVALAVFLRRHAVDVPLLIDVLYLEIVVGAGMALRRLCGASRAREASDYVQAFVLGFVAWSVIAWTASAFGFGSIRQLRALTLALGLVAPFGRAPPLLVFLWRTLRAQPRANRIWSGALAAWIALLYARTNVVYGYDSLWYGLRGEYVLDPGHSVFEPLGLVSPVHYFPKLYEVFLLPVSALGDSSVIGGMSICVLVLILIVCARIADRIGLDPAARLPVLALIATLPALAATAIEPKPDAIATLFVLVAADAALGFARTRSLTDACWLVAGAALACVAKLIAIPFVGILVLVAASHAWRERHAGGRRDASVAAMVAAAGALVVTIFVTARTWLLAGMPTVGPDPLFRLWSALGLHLRPPVGTLEWTSPQDWSTVPGLVVDWLFRPQTMPHIVISWVGNAWFWFMLVGAAAMVAGWRARDRETARWPLFALVAAGAALALGIRYQVRGSDGNYFLAALLPGVLLAANATLSRVRGVARTAVLACIPAFALFQAAYAFASTGWATGTRAFDFDLARNWHDSRALRWPTLRLAGMEKIGRHLKELRASTRTVGYATEPASLWLPTRFENLLTISYSRPEFVETEAALEGFLRDQHIEGLVLPQPAVAAKEYAYVPLAVAAVAARLEREPGVVRIDDRDYYLLDLSAWRAR
jgi:hypothetical protein